MTKTQPQYNIKAAGRLRAFRIKYIHKSQTKAAKLLGENQTNLSRMENGVAPITIDFLNQLTDEYGLNQTYIIDGSGTEIDPNPPKNQNLKSFNELILMVQELTRKIQTFEANLNRAYKLGEQQERRISELERELLKLTR